jgi:hypothetical protein
MFKAKESTLYSVYTTMSANKSRTLFQVYCLLLQQILNWGKSYIYVPGNKLTISPTLKVFTSHTENKIIFPMH